jgi:iron complex outermembrane receptor protein
MTRSLGGHGALALAVLLAAHAANADDAPAAADSGRTFSLAPITVSGVAESGSLTVPSIAAQKDTIDQTVGSVGFVDAESFQNRYANTLRDVLKDSPGVFVENRYGQELRLSVRGSGIARSYHTRGIEILQDGIPTNLADGSGDFYQIDPLGLRSVEIYKGGNGLRFGASTLGGAINFVTPTAYTALAPNILRLDGGSFGTIRGNAQMSRIVGNWDFLGNFTTVHADGYRRHDTTHTNDFNGNIGYRFSPNIETRFYFGAYLVKQELPGALTLDDALHHPKRAAPASLSGNQARDVWVERLANRTTVRLGLGRIDFDSWVVHKRLFHPIFQVLDENGWTYGFAPRWTAPLTVAGMRDELIVGARFFAGDNKALRYLNDGGHRGQKTLNARTQARNYEGYFENRLYFLPHVAWMVGAKAFHDTRDYLDKGGLALDPARKSADKSYDAINPKVGFLWEPTPDIQAFIDVTRSRDVPDFTDLAQTIGATAQFVPLAAQRAWTAEIGTRGRSGRFAWDVTAYRSWLRGELLNFTVDPSVPASTFNAGRTIHQGIELGASVDVARRLLSPRIDDLLTLSQLWNFSDFRFHHDAQFGGNDIAGVPRHVLRTTLTYTHPSGFYFAPAIDWVPRGAWADQANTLRAPSYVLLGLETGIDLPNGWSLFLDARNLTDKRYVSDISTVNDARTANTAIFYPGEGRSVFAGIRYAF